MIVAVLGTGIMGAPMARNLARAGHALRVWNRTAEKAEALADVAEVAATAAEAASGADVVLTMLDNSAVVTAVLLDQGVLAAAPRALVIDMSSIAPDTARNHGARVVAGGGGYLDAPVSGGERGAIDGTLAIMAGGTAADFARAEAIFAPLGRATHVGPVGSGQTAKLANQIIVGVTVGAVAEALALATAAGCDPAAVRAAMMGGFAGSPILAAHGQRMIDGNWVPGGRVRLQLKDLDNVAAAAEGLGIELPLAAQARAAFADLAGPMGMGELDHSAYYIWLGAGQE